MPNQSGEAARVQIREASRSLNQALQDAVAAGSVVLTSDTHPVALEQDGRSSPARSAGMDHSTRHESTGPARGRGGRGDRYLVDARTSTVRTAATATRTQAWARSLLRRMNIKLSSKASAPLVRSITDIPAASPKYF